ncbi:MAG: hypothetical protein HZA28_00870 [Candidatus Omnitrophica bacterium]|nr:hypothetical protein [Candidatus Omnitrophota bacterium]
MTDLQRKELRGHSTISRTTIEGWPAVFFSLPFIGAGTFIILISLNVIPVKDSSFHAAREVVASFGGLFALAGLLTLVHGLLSLNEKRKTALLNQQYSTEKWRADYSWDPQGIKADSFEKIKSGLYANLGITVFCVPFNWLFFFKHPDRIFQLFIGFFDIIIVIAWAYWAYLVLALLKYGVSSLEFQHCPFFLGEELKVILRTNKPVPGLKEMKATLRHIEEKYETRGTGKNRRSVIVSYQLYADTLTFNNLTAFEQQAVQWPLAFSLPQESQYNSCLSCRPAKYWELEIKAQTPGIDYFSSFLLPVYAKL